MLTRNRREALAGQALALVEGSDTALMVQGQAQTLLRQSVQSVTHPHTFISSPGASPLLLPASPQPLLRLRSSARSWAEPQQRERLCKSAALDAISGKLPNEPAEPYMALCRSYSLRRG